MGPADQLPADCQKRSLSAIASATGDELGMIRAFATKHQQANTDTLTGLANRRSLEARIPHIFARGGYTVAFIDIDRFKPLNDTHGHETGDRALRLFADVLRRAVRPDDLVARWGGVKESVTAKKAKERIAVLKCTLHGAGDAGK